MTSELSCVGVRGRTDDSVMTPEGVNSIPVVIDLMSLGLMKGMSQLTLECPELMEQERLYITLQS